MRSFEFLSEKISQTAGETPANSSQLANVKQAIVSKIDQVTQTQQKLLIKLEWDRSQLSHCI
jgi:hypothetical protein